MKKRMMYEKEIDGMKRLRVLRLRKAALPLLFIGLFGLSSCNEIYNQLKSNVNELSSLTIKAGTDTVALNPDFNGTISSYTAKVGLAVTSVNVVAVLKDSKAALSINGQAADSGVGVPLDFSTASTSLTVTIVVIAENEDVNKYTVVISRSTGNNSPSAPASPVPAAGATGVQVSGLTLSWTCTDPDGDSLKYDIHFGEGSTPPDTANATDLLSSSWAVADTLKTETLYSWKVVARDGDGAVASSPVWTFTTTSGLDNHPPSAPFDPDPEDGATAVLANNLMLSWDCEDPDDDTLSYDIYFGEGSTPPGTPLAINLTNHVWLVEDTLAYSTLYSWKITARDGSGAVASSPVWTFTTGAALANPRTISGTITKDLGVGEVSKSTPLYIYASPEEEGQTLVFPYTSATWPFTYTLTEIPPGTYYVGAFIQLTETADSSAIGNASGDYPGEVDVSSEDAASINFVLEMNEETEHSLYGSMILPAAAEGSDWYVMIDDDDDPENGGIATESGTCGESTSVDYIIENLSEGVYDIFYWVDTDGNNDISNGDFWLQEYIVIVSGPTEHNAPLAEYIEAGGFVGGIE